MAESLLKTKALKNLSQNLDPPFSRFEGLLKQLHVEALADVFDQFFPRFRTEFRLSSFVTRGRGRGFFGGVTFAGDSAVFSDRGRERRFSGDETLQRKRYYCLADAATNDPVNNTLLCELFAYADPRFPLLPELLDTTVDIEQGERLCKAMGWDPKDSSILQIVRPRDEPWLLSPVLGIGAQGGVIRYPLTIVEERIDRTIDLRLPNTLKWFFDVFVSMEVLLQGHFVDKNGHCISTLKGEPPQTVPEFLPTILAQTLGGGSTFIQGVGACLRSIGAQALIFPSARSDSRSVTQNGTVQESFGYVLVNYRDAPPCAFEPARYFGGLPNWGERIAKRISVTYKTRDGREQLEVTGARRLQEFRYAVFHDWTVNSLARSRHDLQAKTTSLGERVQLAIRRPSTILGPDSNKVLGDDSEFLIEEGGPATGFLVEWRVGPYNTVAEFICSVLPAAQSEFWEDRWTWDGESWFLSRLCRLRPRAILKCPVCLVEYFWDIPTGSPLPSCAYCKFTHDAFDGTKMQARYVQRGRQLAIEEKEQSIDIESAPGDMEIYSAVCERHTDAVTGLQPAMRPGPSHT